MKGNFGYLSPEPCRVCKGHVNNQQHPTLGFVVCELHQETPPHKIPPLPRLQKKDPDFLKWPPTVS